MTYRVRLIASTICLFSAYLHAANASASIIGAWQFNNSLANSVSGGSSATLDGSFAGSTYSNTTINGGSATVLNFPRGSSFADRIGIPNDLGVAIPEYTIVMDFLFPAFQSNWSGFIEISQSGDGDYFVEQNGDVELYPNPQSAPGVFSLNTWHRVGVTRNASNFIRIYVDGVQVASGIGSGSSIQSSGLWLFTDNDTETSLGSVNSVALFDEVLSSGAMANLGGASAEGIGSQATIPEPASLAIWGGIGLAGLVVGWRRKRMRAATA